MRPWSVGNVSLSHPKSDDNPGTLNEHEEAAYTNPPSKSRITPTIMITMRLLWPFFGSSSVVTSWVMRDSVCPPNDGISDLSLAVVSPPIGGVEREVG